MESNRSQNERLRMNSADFNIVTVENLMPHLRKSYGKEQQLGRDKANRGVNAGIYKIVYDPLCPIEIAKNREIMPVNKHNMKYGNKLISIIVLAMGQLVYTQKCIVSLQEHTKCNYQLIFVDNCSDDGTVEWIKKKLKTPDILICNAENKGFSRGNNQALAIASGEYILFLNNDTEILEDNWLDSFIVAMDAADIVGPDLKKLSIDPSGGIFIYVGDGTKSDPYNYLEGWCLFGKKTVLKALGGFDERFSPAYSEDVDLSFSAYSKGYKLEKIENKKVRHFGNKTSQTMGAQLNVLSTINRKKLYQKWLGDNIKKICLRRDGAKGDVLMCTPIIRELKEKYPTANIIFQTHSPELIANNPYISQIIPDAQTDKYDIDIKLSYEDQPGRVRIDAMAEQAGIKLKSRKMEVFFKPINLDIPHKYIVCHTGMSWPNRMWPMDRWRSLVGKIAAEYEYKIYFVGDKLTKIPAHKNVVDSRNRGWDYVAALLKGAEFFLGIDSSVSNVAKAVRCKAYIFYGCVNPAVMIADADEIPLIDSNLDCFGCRDKSSQVYVECTKKKPFCLTNITAEKVIKKIKRGI